MKCKNQIGVPALFAFAFAAGSVLAQDAPSGSPPGNSAPPAAAPAAPAVPAAPGAGMARPCKDDIAKLCPEAKTFREKMQCLKANTEKLSDACKARVTKMKEKREEFKVACKDDIAKYCADVKGRPRMIMGCLMGNRDRLSEACGKKVAEAKEWREKRREHEGSGAAQPQGGTPGQ